MPIKICIIKAMVFPVVMYGCESWTIKKTEHWRIDAFELWCWRRLLRVPWIARRSNQSTLKEINPEHSLEGLMLKLKLQYLGHLMWRTDPFEKTQMLGRINKGPNSQSYGFSSSHGWMSELDHKEGWTPKNWCFWAVVLKKTLENPLDSKETKQVYPRGTQSWIFIERTDAEAEAPIVWPPDVKGRLIGKDSDAGKNWRREEKGVTEDEMVGCYHRLNGHEFE